MADEMQDIQMDLDNLYQEEVFTDRRIGSIMRLTPVTAEGETDTGRDVLYVGQTQIMTPAGALPLSFEIEAKSLKEAIEGFPAAAQKSVDDTMERLKEMRREAPPRWSSRKAAVAASAAKAACPAAACRVAARFSCAKQRFRRGGQPRPGIIACAPPPASPGRRLPATFSGRVAGPPEVQSKPVTSACSTSCPALRIVIVALRRRISV
ncbi:hypothetical protein [Alkalilimnicola ehrlichii]|uniref:hypothetical protein n=1 Tax=Alkalilimnicola ehrlichii TaxID=351052 RepID=UPI00216389FA|nr:hypothetical protein [Alkalilimnicola ehrlichii]